MKRVDQTKFLGIFIGENLTWKGHINSMMNKISKTIRIVCKLQHFTGQKILRNIYYSLIYPHLYYANIIWANNYHSGLRNCWNCHKKCQVRANPYIIAPSSPIFHILKLFNIHQINDFIAACFTFKLINKSLPTYFSSKFFMSKIQMYINIIPEGQKHWHQQYNRTNYDNVSTWNKLIWIWTWILLDTQQHSITYFSQNILYNMKLHILIYPNNI